MQPRVAQPNAATLSEDVVRTLVAALAPEASTRPIRTTSTDVHSNDVAMAGLADGRTLVIKRGRFHWCAARFDTSRRAFALLRGAGIVAPAPLDLPRTPESRPIEAYWWIDLPTMDEIWPSLDEPSRAGLLRGLGVVAIGSNDAERYPEDGPAAMRREKEAHGYPFPYLYDETQQVARSYGAACTPDFFLFDVDRRLAYRGQFDDSRPGNGVAVTGGNLRAAVDAVLSGQPVPGEQKPSIGCSIKWKHGNAPGEPG